MVLIITVVMVANHCFCGCPEARSKAFSPKLHMGYNIAQQDNDHVVS